MTEPDSTSLLVRTKSGKMVHVRGCHYAHWGKPWVWAEGKTREEIGRDTMFLGISFCKTCKPLEAVDNATAR